MTYDALNDPPIPASMQQRMRRNHPRCPECGFEPWSGHHPRCSESPVETQVAFDKAQDHPSWYSYTQQDRHYREQAREEGCTCRDLPAHTHAEDCPAYVFEPRDRAEYLAYLEEEHRQDAELP
jgi:hypothetical protein